MSLYYITGIAGSGKSTALSELRNRGYEAYDVDEAGPATAKWHNNVTGFIHPKSSITKADRTPEFIASHSWIVPPQEVADLAERAGSGTIFLGGSVANEDQLLGFFRAVFALAIDDDTLTHRLASRTNNDWGKNPHELELTLATNHELSARYEKLGYVVIAANQEPNKVVNEIIRNIHDN